MQRLSIKLWSQVLLLTNKQAKSHEDVQRAVYFKTTRPARKKKYASIDSGLNMGDDMYVKSMIVVSLSCLIEGS